MLELHTLAREQLVAQLDYHAEDGLDLRQKRYQPRMRACPSLDQ